MDLLRKRRQSSLEKYLTVKRYRNSLVLLHTLPKVWPSLTRLNLRLRNSSLDAVVFGKHPRSTSCGIRTMVAGSQSHGFKLEEEPIPFI